ncbi:MAG TPA: ABC transporter permease [Vicinamibacteria bacterium]|nr:ABC transporter permease [Vicinamibacteria bacterium]
MQTTGTAAAPPDLSLDVSARPRESLWVRLRPVYPFLVVMLLWELAARQAQERNLGQLFPTLEGIAARAWELVTGPLLRALESNPDLPLAQYLYYLGQSPLLWHTLATAWRLPLAFAIGAVIGVAIGMLMGRLAFWESFFVPLIAVLLPIPALAWTPIAVLWFGLGDPTVIVVIAFASFLPVAMAVWTGVKTVNPVWIRAAQSMNASRMTIFRTVVLPGSLPMIMSGMRIGLARAWRAGVGAEAFAGIRWGLSAGIFNAQEFLDISFMMVALAVLGLFGYALEKVLFQPVESRTLIRWGMMEAMGAQNRKA